MSITLRGGVWHCHFVTPSGKRIRRSLGAWDKKQARELHDKLKAEAWRVDKIGELPMRTFEECCIRWIREKEHKRSLDDNKTKIEFSCGISPAGIFQPSQPSRFTRLFRRWSTVSIFRSGSHAGTRQSGRERNRRRILRNRLGRPQRASIFLLCALCSRLRLMTRGG